jgi:FKBP-type peptidyl-prolyl cis-trans isomerase 2
MRRRMLSVMVLMGLLFLLNSNVKGEPVMIADGKKVQFDYTLTVDGAVVDTSEGRTPLEYVQGEGHIIQGLEKQMVGLVVGDSRTLSVSASEAYGEINPEAMREIPRAQFPENITPEVGQQLGMTTPEGQTIPVKIAAFTDETITIDFNHPLAGKDLTFDVTIVSID